VYEVPMSINPEGRRGELIVALSRDQIEQVISNETLSSFEITGGAMLILVVLTILIVNSVVGRPVATLQSAMNRVEAGALDERVKEVRSDEIGALSRGFNAMLDRLHTADREIRAFNRRLADEIRAATLDLERKNEALAQLNRLLNAARREIGDKERLAALGQLAAQLAHEIGTPLGSVSGHLQLAMSGGDVPTPLKDRLQVASRELERVSKIVRDYLDSTRRVVPERVTVDVARLLDEAIGIALSDEARANLIVEKRVDAAAAAIETDPGLLRQILINLLTNAADAGGGKIQLVARTNARGRPSGVSAANASEEVASPWRALELAVHDDGAGIPPEDVARIFEPFYTTKGRGKGTGLGLSICRELAQALGARLTVESAPGKGSTFTVILPTESKMRQVI
jgi:signal transduction histidine kinase